LAATVVLLHTGVTAWCEQGRIIGRRDISLTEAGKAQAKHALSQLGDTEITEILSSPISSALQTSEVLAQHYHLGIGRDPRLIELGVGKWEGANWSDFLSSPDLHSVLAGESSSFNEGESFQSAMSRAVASVEQAAADNPASATIVIVTHAFLTRLILTYYLGMPCNSFLRLIVNHGSLSIIRSLSEMPEPSVQGINLAVPVTQLLSHTLG
jgi:broad specificity phosphatase PhoE